MVIYGGEDGDESKLQVKSEVEQGGGTWRCGGGVERGVGGARGRRCWACWRRGLPGRNLTGFVAENQS